MQKILIGILAVGTVVLGIVCVVQSNQLRTLREQLRVAEEKRTVEAETRDAQTARVKELERSNRQLEQQVQKFAAVTTQLRTNEAAQADTLKAFSERVRAGQAAPGATGDDKEGLFGKGMGEMIGKMMKDPAMREMMREQQKAMINMMYSGLFKDLNLTPDEKEKFKTLLTDAQMKNVEAAQGLFGGDSKDGNMEDAGKQIAEAKKQTDAEIKALLGDDRFAQYQDYQKVVGERMQLDQFKNQLTGENMPLTDEQQARLLQVMKETKTSMPPPISDYQTQIPKKDTFTAENLDKQLKWMDDRNQQILEAITARQILTPEQLKQYQSFQEQQTSMQKLGLNMAKQMFGGEKSGGAVTTPAPVK